MDTLKDWQSISDLAKTIGISRKTIWAWVRDGKLRSHRFGIQHRITEADWRMFVAECNTRGKDVRKEVMTITNNTKTLREQNESDMRQQIENAVQETLLLYAPPWWSHLQCETAEQRMLEGALAALSAMTIAELRSPSELQQQIEIAVAVLPTLIHEYEGESR